MSGRIEIAAAEIEKQKNMMRLVREELQARVRQTGVKQTGVEQTGEKQTGVEQTGVKQTGEKQPLAYVDTYGCQQNESDSEKLRGMLAEMGCGFTDDEYAADIVMINTCAIRENAENRVFGNVGALVHTKNANRSQIIVFCGCMAGVPESVEKIRESYAHVDLVFSPNALWRFPELLYSVLTRNSELVARPRHRRVFEIDVGAGAIAEGLPLHREGTIKAWLPVMYGCNNFCSYCIVPYVRGRERSRAQDVVLDEARALVKAGYKDITLLGQNVNSYGAGLTEKTDFATLIRRINDIEGEFLIRFMTSHPKDASIELFRAMAESEKAARHIHLPFQSGSDRILRLMNRGYTHAEYLDKAAAARELMPDIVITSDVIVGFPGETLSDVDDTVRLVEEVRFDAMFTFIYSKRPGTPASKFEDTVTREEKQIRFDRVLDLQNAISDEKHAAYIGKTVRVLVDEESHDERYPLKARTNGGRLVHLLGDSKLVGSFIDVKITHSNSWSLFGES